MPLEFLFPQDATKTCTYQDWVSYDSECCIHKNRKQKRKLILEKGRDHWMKGTHKHTEAQLIHFDFTDVFLNQKKVNWCKHTIKMLSHVFKYIYSLLINKDICECQNVSGSLTDVFMCAFYPVISWVFLVRVFSFFFYFCVIHISVLSLSKWMLFVFFIRE